MPRRAELLQTSKPTGCAVSTLPVDIRRGEAALCLGLAFIQHLGKTGSFHPLRLTPSLLPPVFAGRAKVKSPVSSMRQRRRSEDGADATGSTGRRQRPECLWPRGSCTRGQEAEGGGSKKKNRNRKLLFISLSARRRVRRFSLS